MPYLTVDVLGIIDDINLRACHALGLPQHRLAGRRFLQFVAPDSRSEFLQFMIRALADERHAVCAVQLLQADGSSFMAHLEGSAVPDKFGVRQCRIIFFDRSSR